MTDIAPPRARAGWAVTMAGFGWLCGALAILELHELGLHRWLAYGSLALLTAGVATMLHLGIVAPIVRQATVERRLRATTERAGATAREQLVFVDQFDDALDLAMSESDVIDSLRRAIVQLLPDRDHSLVLCDPSGALAHSIPLQADGFGPPRHLGHPMTCPALVTGTTGCAGSRVDMGSCAHLSVADAECSSICIPLRAPGLEMGVVRSVGPAGDLPDATLLRRVERTMRRSAARIAALRTAGGDQSRMVVDPDPVVEIKGEVDRQTVERVAHELIARLERFSLAVCALDGRDPRQGDGDRTWDARSMRLLGEVLDDTLRPTDVIGRTGDTFMLLLPDADRASALAALERVRENLVLRLAEGELDPFTVSIGVAESAGADGLDELVESAELALLTAARQGGNRVRAWAEATRRSQDASSPTD